MALTMTLNTPKPSYRGNWYQQNKQRLSEKRKKLYAENPEYREQRREASRRYRRGERTHHTPADTPIPLAEAAKRVGVGVSTIREWRRKKLFPEPTRHNRGFFFTENQVSLLKELKVVSRKYRMRPSKIKEERLQEVRALMSASWNGDCKPSAQSQPAPAIDCGY